MNLKVGQILYVVPSQQAIIYPMQVVEELTKKTLNGTEVDYVLRAGSATESKTIKLKEIKGEIYESAVRAKTVLTDRAIKSVARLVESATKKAEEWYPGAFEGSSDDNIIDALKKPSAHEAVGQDTPRPASADPAIDLGDGIVARVKLPDVLKD
jgi:hypothetical protein